MPLLVSVYAFLLITSFLFILAFGDRFSLCNQGHLKTQCHTAWPLFLFVVLGDVRDHTLSFQHIQLHDPDQHAFSIMKLSKINPTPLSCFLSNIWLERCWKSTVPSV